MKVMTDAMQRHDATRARSGVLTVHTVGETRHITLNRPEHRNALTPELCRELAGALDEAGRDEGIRVVTLRGANNHFCVGLDLKWFLSLGPTPPPQILEDGLGHFQESIRAIVRCPLPVVALLEGSAAGFGLDLALACDFRLATESTVLTSAFARMGLVPDGGSTFTLPRLIGRERAMAVLVAGETLDARRAFDLGLVSRVVPDQGVEEATAALAARIVENARSSVAQIKTLLRHEDFTALEDQLALEGRAQIEALQAPEFAARLRAFVSRSSRKAGS